MTHAEDHAATVGFAARIRGFVKRLLRALGRLAEKIYMNERDLPPFF